MDGCINNVMIDNGDPYYIDQEWLCSYELPAEFLFYLSLLHISKVIAIIPLNIYLEKYSISKKKQDVFLNIYNNYFKGENA